MATNQGFVSFVPSKEILPEFLAYALLAHTASIVSLAGSTTFKEVTRSSIKDVEIPVPTVAEQTRIVSLLDEAEALRTLRSTADKLALSLAPALFRQVFGDPVNNTGSWRVSSVGDHLTMLEYGPRFYNEAYTEAGTRIVRITDLEPDGTLRFDDMPRIDVDAKTLVARQLRPGDFVFARSGATVGKVALITEDAPPCIAGAYFIRFRFSETIDPVFGFELLRSPAIQGIIAQQSKQAAQQNFSGPLIRALPLILPPRELQHSFAGHVRMTRPLLSAQSKSRSQLDANFQSLMNKAFRGEI
jgi:type I restriction enzyme S subunit